MFAYAEVDGEVADLRDAITGKDGFGEQNQWTVEVAPSVPDWCGVIEVVQGAPAVGYSYSRSALPG
jgi:hypothetical protein